MGLSSQILDESWIVVADTFLGIHAASELKVKGRNAFLCNAVWASIGHSVGAAVGAPWPRVDARS
jgi:indolepyruvate decarboxylase